MINVEKRKDRDFENGAILKMKKANFVTIGCVLAMLGSMMLASGCGNSSTGLASTSDLGMRAAGGISAVSATE